MAPRRRVKPGKVPKELSEKDYNRSKFGGG